MNLLSNDINKNNLKKNMYDQNIFKKSKDKNNKATTSYNFFKKNDIMGKITNILNNKDNYENFDCCYKLGKLEPNTYKSKEIFSNRNDKDILDKNSIFKKKIEKKNLNLLNFDFLSIDNKKELNFDKLNDYEKLNNKENNNYEKKFNKNNLRLDPKSSENIKNNYQLFFEKKNSLSEKTNNRDNLSNFKHEDAKVKSSKLMNLKEKDVESKTLFLTKFNMKFKNILDGNNSNNFNSSNGIGNKINDKNLFDKSDSKSIEIDNQDTSYHSLKNEFSFLLENNKNEIFNLREMLNDVKLAQYKINNECDDIKNLIKTANDTKNKLQMHKTDSKFYNKNFISQDNVNNKNIFDNNFNKNKKLKTFYSENKYSKFKNENLKNNENNSKKLHISESTESKKSNYKIFNISFENINDPNNIQKKNTLEKKSNKIRSLTETNFKFYKTITNNKENTSTPKLDKNIINNINENQNDSIANNNFYLLKSNFLNKINNKNSEAEDLVFNSTDIEFINRQIKLKNNIDDPRNEQLKSNNNDFLKISQKNNQELVNTKKKSEKEKYFDNELNTFKIRSKNNNSNQPIDKINNEFPKLDNIKDLNDDNKINSKKFQNLKSDNFKIFKDLATNKYNHSIKKSYHQNKNKREEENIKSSIPIQNYYNSQQFFKINKLLYHSYDNNKKINQLDNFHLNKKITNNNNLKYNIFNESNKNQIDKKNFIENLKKISTKTYNIYNKNEMFHEFKNVLINDKTIQKNLNEFLKNKNLNLISNFELPKTIKLIDEKVPPYSETNYISK